MKIKVVTFNVQHFENFYTHKIDYEGFAEAIKSFNADIIGLNEVRGKGDREDYADQTEIIADKLGYYCYFAQATLIDGNNPYGNAILSKYPIISEETKLIPDPENKAYGGYYETRCLLKAKIKIEKEINIIVTHFGLNLDEQINCVKTVCNNISERCILMGDFNVTPDNDLLKPIKNFLTDTSYSDKTMLSFPSDNPEKKIDYIFIGSGLKTIYSEIIPLIISDHRPYFSEIEIL